MYKIQIVEEAYVDIKEAFDYYESLKIGLGKRFIASVNASLGKLKLFPQHYQVKRFPYRELYLSNFPYAIIYEFLNEEIIVFAVFCTHKNPESKPT